MIDIITSIMEEVEHTYNNIKNIKYSKKQTALFLIKKKIGFEEYEKYNTIIGDLIDFICNITKKNIKIEVNKKCKTCFYL